MSRLQLMAPLLGLLEVLSFVNTGDGKVIVVKQTHACLPLCFQEVELAHSSPLLLSQSVCVLMILVLCDSPCVAVWPKLGLWFTQMPPKLLHFQLDQYNVGTFLGHFFVTLGLPSMSEGADVLTEGAWLWWRCVGLVFLLTLPWHDFDSFGLRTITMACGCKVVKDAAAGFHAASRICHLQIRASKGVVRSPDHFSIYLWSEEQMGITVLTNPLPHFSKSTHTDSKCDLQRMPKKTSHSPTDVMQK